MDIFGWINVPIWLLLLIFTVVLIYLFLTWTHDTFTKMGVPGPKPWPIMGTQYEAFAKYSDFKKYDRDIIDKYGKFVGIYEGRRPVLLVSDIEAIKQVLVKDFSTFINRQQMVDPSLMKPPFDKGLTIITGDHWRHARNLLTPTFTTGKLKRMMPQINHCADLLVDNLQELAEKNQDIDIKVHTGNFSMDVIASVAFGLQINTQKEQNSTFVQMANRAMKPKMILIFVMLLVPYLAKPLTKLGVKLFNFETGPFFQQLVQKAIEERKSQNMQQSDFLQLMLNAHVEKPTVEDMADEELAQSIRISDGITWTTKGLTEEEIICQAVLFLLAGYETTANTLRYLCYELAVNREAHDKLMQEIDEVTKGQSITPEMVTKLEYTEMCIMETLRLHPPGLRTNREAGHDTTVGGFNIPKGFRIDIPIAALHYDPVIYPQPEKFIPERFSAAERAARSPYYWMPFGAGPRNCIGIRLAMLELKIAIAKILQKMNLVKCAKTEIPIQMKLIGPKNPVMIGAEIR